MASQDFCAHFKENNAQLVQAAGYYLIPSFL